MFHVQPPISGSRARALSPAGAMGSATNMPSGRCRRRPEGCARQTPGNCCLRACKFFPMGGNLLPSSNTEKIGLVGKICRTGKNLPADGKYCPANSADMGGRCAAMTLGTRWFHWSFLNQEACKYGVQGKQMPPPGGGSMEHQEWPLPASALTNDPIGQIGRP